MYKTIKNEDFLTETEARAFASDLRYVDGIEKEDIDVFKIPTCTGELWIVKWYEEQERA